MHSSQARPNPHVQCNPLRACHTPSYSQWCAGLGEQPEIPVLLYYSQMVLAESCPEQAGKHLSVT